MPAALPELGSPARDRRDGNSNTRCAGSFPAICLEGFDKVLIACLGRG